MAWGERLISRLMAGPAGLMALALSWGLAWSTGLGEGGYLRLLIGAVAIGSISWLKEGSLFLYGQDRGTAVTTLDGLIRHQQRKPEERLLGQGCVWTERVLLRWIEYRRTQISTGRTGTISCRSMGRHSSLSIDLSTLGHTLVMGAPGTGKTRAFTLWIAQALLRDRPVIFIDPKGGANTLGVLRRLCHRLDKPLYSVLAGSPDAGLGLDLLAHSRSASELAGRICQLLPADEVVTVFGRFAQMVLQRLVEGLWAAKRKVDLRELRFHVADQGNTLLTWLKTRNPSLVDEPVEYQEVLRNLSLLVRHDATHYAKLALSLTALLDTLGSGVLGKLLSGAETAPPLLKLDQIIAQNGLLYVSLSSLTDPAVARGLGGLLLSDLAALAGDRYRDGTATVRLEVFVDEAAEISTPAFIQLLNKGRECGVQVTFAVQTLADLEVAMGGHAPARMMIGNAAHLIAFRTLDPESREAISRRAGSVWIPDQRSVASAQTRIGLSRRDEGQGAALQRGWKEQDLLPEQLLANLPDLEFFGFLTGPGLVAGQLTPLEWIAP